MLAQTQAVQDFLTTQNAEVAIVDFLINLALASGLSMLVAAVYVRFASTVSNRRTFARNFIFIAVTTTLVITVVKSSLALSLGLVGALSIVRFRTAIKDPEELAYLFLTIAIGLGLGAGQRAITLVAVASILSVVIASRLLFRRDPRSNLYVTVSSGEPESADLDVIVRVLERHSSALSITRFDATSEVVEAAFRVEFPRFQALQDSKQELQRLNGKMRISFLDESTPL